jgi:hypothetical protein
LCGPVHTSYMTQSNDTAAAKLTALFSNFSKWDTYGAAFKMVDAGECNLIDVQDAASVIGINPSVVAMRRRDIIKMAW